MDLRPIAHAEVIVESLAILLAFLLDLGCHRSHLLLLLNESLLYLDALVDLGRVRLVLVRIVRVRPVHRDAAVYFQLGNVLVNRQLTAVLQTFALSQIHSQLLLLTVDVSCIHTSGSIFQRNLLLLLHCLVVFLI